MSYKLWKARYYCFVKPPLLAPSANHIPKSTRIIYDYAAGTLGPDTDFSTWGQPYPNCNYLTNRDSQSADDGNHVQSRNIHPFSMPVRKRLVSGQWITEHILARVPPGEPREQKSRKTRLSTTRQWRRVTLQVSKPQSQKMKPSAQTAGENGYQKNTKQLLRAELRQGRYPPGGQAKPWESTLKPSLKQCYRAADSWATTAWKHRLVATEAEGGGGGTQVHKQLRKHPGGRPSEMKQQARPAGPPWPWPWPWPPGPRGGGQWHRHTQTYCGRKHTSHQPAQGRGANRVPLAEMWLHVI